MTSETAFTVGSDPDTLEKIESTGCLRRLGAVLTGLGVIWLALLFKAHEAGPFGLRIEAVFLLGRRVVEIPPEELEELILLKPEAPRLPSEQASAEEWKWSLDHGRMPDGTEAPRALRWAWRLAGTQGILARSDRQSVTFAAGLPPDELAYLHALLLRALA